MASNLDNLNYDACPNEQIAEVLSGVERLIERLNLSEDVRANIKQRHDYQLGEDFDFEKLLATFALVFPDINNGDVTVETKDTPSKIFELAFKILFEIGPEAHRLKKPNRDIMWKFHTIEGGKKLCVIVATFKSTAPPKKQPELENGMLLLTAKQAGLIAMHAFARITPYLVLTDQFKLTPLAQNVFAASDIIEIFSAFNGNVTPSNEDISNLVMEINESCQPGGEYLSHSTGEVALLSAIWGTRDLKNEVKKKSIIETTIQRYFYRKKPVNLARFKILSNFVHGGLPAKLERFINIFNRGLLLKRCPQNAGKALTDDDRVSDNDPIALPSTSAQAIEVHADLLKEDSE